MVVGRIGGINVFGGGLALYDKKGELIGGLGGSGDSSCADHNVAWKTRAKLELDFVPVGVSETQDDNIIYTKDSPHGHPQCVNSEKSVSEVLPKSFPIRKKALIFPIVDRVFFSYS